MYSPPIFERSLSKLRNYEELWTDLFTWLKLVQYILHSSIHFTQLTVPPHCVFCWISHNRTFQHFSAGNINSPVNTMSSRHNSVRTDDWTATYVTTLVLKRHLKTLLKGRFNGIKKRSLRRWTLKSLRNLELRNFFLDVKSHNFTWYG